jgi:hypothetical protein
LPVVSSTAFHFPWLTDLYDLEGEAAYAAGQEALESRMLSR